MVLLPLYRFASRSLGRIVLVLAFAILLLFLGLLRHAYDQHQKFKRLEGYSQYVHDVANQMDQVEIMANRTHYSIERISLMLGKKPVISTKAYMPNKVHFEGINASEQHVNG